jgi:hypothetical protein
MTSDIWERTSSQAGASGPSGVHFSDRKEYPSSVSIQIASIVIYGGIDSDIDGIRAGLMERKTCQRDYKLVQRF